MTIRKSAYSFHSLPNILETNKPFSFHILSEQLHTFIIMYNAPLLQLFMEKSFNVFNNSCKILTFVAVPVVLSPSPLASWPSPLVLLSLLSKHVAFL